MHDHRIHLTTVNHQRYFNYVDFMLGYIKRHSDKPLHKIFKMSRQEFAKFLSDVRSYQADRNAYSLLVSKYFEFYSLNLNKLFIETFEDHIYNPYVHEMSISHNVKK